MSHSLQLYFTTFHYFALRSIIFHSVPFNSISLRYGLHFVSLRYVRFVSLRCVALRYVAVEFTNLTSWCRNLLPDYVPVCHIVINNINSNCSQFNSFTVHHRTVVKKEKSHSRGATFWVKSAAPTSCRRERISVRICYNYLICYKCGTRSGVHFIWPRIWIDGYLIEVTRHLLRMLIH